MIPSFPPGATLFSLYEASVRMGRFASIRSGLSAFTRHPTAFTKPLLLGYRASDFCRIVLEDAVEPTDLLQEHTLFPIFTSLSWNFEAEEELRRQTISGSKYAIGLLQVPDYGSYFSDKHRFCRKCIHEDLEKYGYVYRRVAHQLSTEHSCTSHNLELWEGCSCTTKAYKWETTVPVCPTCKKAAVPISEATEESGKHVLNILNNAFRRILNNPELERHRRRISMREIIRDYNLKPKLVTEKFLDWLQINDFSGLPEILKTDLYDRSLDSIICGAWCGNYRMRLIAGAFAWEQLSLRINRYLENLNHHQEEGEKNQSKYR